MAVQEVPALTCANPDCKVPLGGKCVEGFPVATDCPQFGKSLVILEGQDAETASRSLPAVRVAHANALSVAEAETKLRQKPCNVIALIGPHDAGKTSLIAGVYDLLQKGPVGPYAFAGSSTLHAFEQACHDSRRESQRDEPHTERTQLGKVTFFHLDFFRTSCASTRGVLIANRAGEDYMNTQADQDLAKGYPELGRADTLTVLADGGKLLSAERHHARRDVRLTLRAFLEAGVTRTWQRLAIVLTKLDAIRLGQERGAAAIDFFEDIVGTVRSEFGAHFLEVRSFQVAASPKSADAIRGEGMIELLEYWMGDPARYQHQSRATPPLRPVRAFGRLQLLAK